MSDVSRGALALVIALLTVALVLAFVTERLDRETIRTQRTTIDRLLHRAP